MDPSTGPLRATRYDIRLAGHLDEHWSSWFEPMVMSHGPDGTTTLSGDVADQSALHGLLSRIRDIGVTLLSVEAR